MADDGMLMNFEIGDAPLVAKPVFKGGRWKDRLTARKVANHKESRMNGEGGGGNESKRSAPAHRDTANREIIQNPRFSEAQEEYIGPNSEARGPKRQRVQVDYYGDAGRQTARLTTGKLPPGSINIGGGKKTTFGDGPGSGPKKTFTDGKPAQIISSLFTFNPSAKTKFEEEEPKEEVEPAKPSNAPLSDEASSFASLGMSRRLAGHLATKLDMKAPTAIQKAAVPQLIAEDSDAFIQAQTGSGKTLAYLLPIVERIMAISAAAESEGVHDKEKKIHRNSGLFAIVLAPTRELCKQIA